MPQQTRSPQRNWGRMVAPRPGPWGLHPLSASLWPGCGPAALSFLQTPGPFLVWGAGGGVRAQAGVRRGQG